METVATQFHAADNPETWPAGVRWGGNLPHGTGGYVIDRPAPWGAIPINDGDWVIPGQLPTVGPGVTVVGKRSHGRTLVGKRGVVVGRDDGLTDVRFGDGSTWTFFAGDLREDRP